MWIKICLTNGTRRSISRGKFKKNRIKDELFAKSELLSEMKLCNVKFNEKIGRQSFGEESIGNKNREKKEKLERQSEFQRKESDMQYQFVKIWRQKFYHLIVFG